jgi:hypothetical protein
MDETIFGRQKSGDNVEAGISNSVSAIEQSGAPKLSLF